MRWSKSTPRTSLAPASRRLSREHLVPALLAFTTAVVVASTLLLHGAPEEKRLAIYSNAANYVLPVIERNGTDYVGLIEVFEPLGSVSAKTAGTHWKFRYYDVESDFTIGKSRARVRGGDFDLQANFLLENGRGLVPLSSLPALLPRVLGGPVSFNQNSRRLMIGNVGVHFTAQVMNGRPPKLVMNFTAPVNPMISTEPGRLRMVFSHEALVAPGSQALTFDSTIIPSATFQENNGAAEVVVSSTLPLFASFSNDGRTITIAPPAQAAAPSQSPSTPAASAVPGPPSPSAPPAIRHYFVVVDPSHGGYESGASLNDQIAEKDVTLALARRLRQELDTRGLTTLLLRDSDVSLSLDQRASLTNSAHPAIYIAVHAASQGSGVRIYTALMPPVAENRGPFLGWDSAQSFFQPMSRTASASLVRALQNKQISARALAAPVRPLNNITTACIAIEVAPSSDDVSQLISATYQQLVVGAVAAGVSDVRDRLEAIR